MLLIKGVPGGTAKVTVVPLVVILPVTGVLALSVRVTVAAVTVAGSTGSLNVAVRAEDVETLVAPSAGVVAVIERGLALRISVVSVPGEFGPHARRFDPKRIIRTRNRRW